MKRFDNFSAYAKHLKKICIKRLPDWNANLFSGHSIFDTPVDQYLICAFYSKYSCFFSHDFLTEKSNRISNAILKEWVQFCLAHIPAFIAYSEKYIIESLEQCCDELGMPYSAISNLRTSNYWPFITWTECCKHGYENMGKVDNTDFQLLLFMHIYAAGYSFELDRSIESSEYMEMWLATQLKMTLDFLEAIPIEGQIEGLSFLFKAYAKINSLNYFKGKLSTSYNEVFGLNKKDLDGELFISWDKVDFFDGCYIIYHPAFPLGGIKHPALKVEDINSRKVFSNIKSVFLKKLVPLHVEVKNGGIVRLLNKPSLDHCIIIMENKALGVNSTKQAKAKPITCKKKELTIEETLHLVQDLKSRYIEFLCKVHLDVHKVICCIENKVNSAQTSVSEYSFMFTIKETPTMIYIAYENAANSRSTFIFPLLKKDKKLGIKAICDYFASEKVNKRQALWLKLADLKLPGNLGYQRVLHNDFAKWSYKILNCEHAQA